MAIVAKVLGEFIVDYFSRVVDDELESRLLVPAPTAKLGRQLQSHLQQNLPNPVASLLVVDAATDSPDENGGWIHAAGLTSRRIGSFSVITQPGQLSRIQESVVGSGGAVRQSFEDEWPWVRDEEHQLFSFPDLVLPSIVASWTEDESHQAWLARFIWCALVPAVKESAERARHLFDHLLDSFDPSDATTCGDIRARFLYHCGIPEPTDWDVETDSYIKETKRRCKDIARRMQSMNRQLILENASYIGIASDEMNKAIDAFFDSSGSHQSRGIDALAISHCMEGLTPAQWNLLDSGTMARLFDIQEPSQLAIEAKIRSESGLLSPAETDLVDGDQCEFQIGIQWSIEGVDTYASDYRIELKHGQRVLYTEDLEEKNGQTLVEIDAEEEFTTNAKKITLTARIIDKRDSIDPQYKSMSVRFHPLRQTRPCVVVVQNPFMVFDSSTDSDEDTPEGVTLSEPSFVFAADLRSEGNCLVTLDSESIELIDAAGFVRRLPSAVDPSLDPSGQSLLGFDFGEPGCVWINLESTGRSTGELNIEDELVQQLKMGRRGKVSELQAQFSGAETIPYASLGGISEENKPRLEITRLMESSENGELPLIVDFSALPASLVQRGRVRISDELFEEAAQFENIIFSAEENSLLDDYRDRRSTLMKIYLDHFSDEGVIHNHPLCSRSPVFLASNQTQIETAIQDYLNAYGNILAYFKTSPPDGWPATFVLTYLDCIVGVKRENSIKFPYFLLGPWHPIIVAQRFQRQAALFAATTRWLDAKSTMNQMAGLFCELDGVKRVHALADTAMYFENAYVSNTSDPNWGIATRVSDSQDLERIASIIFTGMSLEIGSVPTGSEALTQSFVKRYLEANPSERRLEIRVRRGLNYRKIVLALANLLYDNNSDKPTRYGRQLPGGVHLYLEEFDPKSVDDLEWRHPPICLYHAPEESEDECLAKHNIDIVIVAPERGLDFKNKSGSPSPIPRGENFSAGLTTTVTWLEPTHTGVASTICHEVEGTSRETNDIVTNGLLGVLEKVGALVSNYFYTVRPLQIPKNMKAAWVIIPGYNADPSAFIQYVSDSELDSEQKVLWEYNIDLEKRRSEYYVLSTVPPGFRHALSATDMAEHNAGAIIRDLGSVGIAIGSESLKTGTKALGVIGQIGAARLLCRLPSTNDRTAVPLRDSHSSAGLLLPVDSFDTLLGSASRDTETTQRKSDLLCIQLDLIGSDSNRLQISACSVECKFSGSTYPSNNVPSALDQARQTYNRFTELVLGSRDDNGTIEKLVLARLFRYGLQLKQKGLRGASQSLERDAKILTAVLCGNVEYSEPSIKHILISTECGLDETSYDGRHGGLWIRLAPHAWPGNNEDSINVKKVRSKIADLFSGRGSPVMDIGVHVADTGSTDAPPSIVDIDEPAPGQDETSSSEIEANDASPTVDAPEAQQPTDSPDDQPETESGIKFPVGAELDVYPDRERFFWPSNTELNQLNMGIVGDLGTGKTQLVKALMLQMHRAKRLNLGVAPKFLIFDYKADYTKPEFAQSIGARVISPKHIPINFFDSGNLGPDVNPAVERARFAFDTLQKIFGGLGPVQEMNLRSAIKEGYRVTRAAGLRAPTIYDVCAEYTTITNGRADAMLAILSGLVDSEIFERDESKIKSLGELFQTSLVLDLKALGQDDRTKNMLVAIFLNLYYEYMLALDKKDFFGPNKELRFIDSTLVVDEADSIMKYNFAILRTLLLQGREFGVGVWLASQFLSHFDTKKDDYKQPLLTWFIHKVPNITDKDLKEIGLTDIANETAEQVKTLKKFQCLYKTFDVPGRFLAGRPFYKLVEQIDG